MMNIALILSGGVGNRFGSDIPKQYLTVMGKMIIEYSLETFGLLDEIDAIQIVADEIWKPQIAEIISCKSIDKVRGFSKPGYNRQSSILNGLLDIECYASHDDIVIIHDAARPNVNSTLIKDCINAINNHDGVLPVLPMKDTVYFSEDSKSISLLLKRECLFAGQAPEAFYFGKYLDANKRLSQDEIARINGSTEPAIMAGLDVVMIPGNESNFKITTQEDMNRFIELKDET